MAKININELKNIMFAEIDKLPDGPHKRDKIRQLKRQLRKIKLEIRLNDGNREVKSEP